LLLKLFNKFDIYSSILSQDLPGGIHFDGIRAYNSSIKAFY